MTALLETLKSHRSFRIYRFFWKGCVPLSRAWPELSDQVPIKFSLAKGD